ncbi:MAG TPA: amidohydrolase family protein [Fimbriimonadaceae bacterium]|nr:amidohydrolase family protein [Fimbriimonadaceae bacterium]
MLLRPYAIVVDGRLEHGLEALFDDEGRLKELRPHTGNSEPFVLSAAFINAHSHLEYRGLMGEIPETDYHSWILAITAKKVAQSEARVREDCLLAAAENRATGVAFIAEHSDRPYSGEAMTKNGLDGVIFQELITIADREDTAQRLEFVTQNLLKTTSEFSGEVHINPHAPWTVDTQSLKNLAAIGGKVSIHVAESVYENELFLHGKGPLATVCKEFGMQLPTGQRVVGYLKDCGLLRKDVQFVHVCDISGEEAEVIARAGVAVAHCPRSNEALNCPRAPVRDMLDAGVLVGLGLDSAASSGPIDMFAEMRAALRVSRERGTPVTPEEVWRMATSMGAQSLGLGEWDVAPGSDAPMIKIHIQDAEDIEELMALASPEKTEWLKDEIPN